MIESLENKKAALELLQNETNEKLNDYKQQISILQKQIDDYNKPALTPRQLDDISEAIEEAVGSYHFDEVDDYDIELDWLPQTENGFYWSTKILIVNCTRFESSNLEFDWLSTL